MSGNTVVHVLCNLETEKLHGLDASLRTMCPDASRATGRAWAMTMIVNGQQLASMTSLFLEQNHGNLARGINRLSSGIRFATSADDAGNLAVSVKLNSSLKRSYAIHKNVQNARSFLTMQEDAYKGLGKIISRMAELRTTVSDPTKSWGDKRDLNLEFKELQQEVQQMSRMKLNGVSLFSTEDQSKFPFYLPTDDKGSKVRVTRTGFFDSLTITQPGTGFTPDFNVSGNTGSMTPEPFALAPQGTVITNPTFDALQGTMPTAEKFTVGVTITPSVMNTKGTDYPSTLPIATHAVTITPDTSGTGATGAAGNVGTGDLAANVTSVNGDGTLNLAISGTPQTQGDFLVQATNSNKYLDPNDISAAALDNLGSGYTKGLPSNVTITGPGATPTILSQDPTTTPTLTVDGATFTFSTSGADKLKVVTGGTPTKVGDYTIDIDPGPLASDKNSVTSLVTSPDVVYDTSAGKPVVTISDASNNPYATVDPSAVSFTNPGDPTSTVTVDLSDLSKVTFIPPTTTDFLAGDTYSVKAADGGLYLDPATSTGANVTGVGSGYTSVFAAGGAPSHTILKPDGSPVVAGDITATITQNVLDPDKADVALSGTPLENGTYKVQITGGPLASDKPSVTSSATTDGLYDAKPAVTIYRKSDNLAYATVDPTAVAYTALTDPDPTKAGTVSVDLSDLSKVTFIPVGVTSFVDGDDYEVKAADGSIYVTPAHVTLDPLGTGYTSGLPTSVTITGPGATPTVVTQDPATPISVDGATFTFSASGTDELKIVTGGAPTKVGDFTIQIGAGPLTSDVSSINDDGTGYSAEPAVKIYDGATGAVLLATVDPSAVTHTALTDPDPTKAGTITIDLSDLSKITPTLAPGSYKVVADDGPAQGAAITGTPSGLGLTVPDPSTMAGTTTGAPGGTVDVEINSVVGTIATELWNTGTDISNSVDRRPVINSAGTIYLVASDPGAGAIHAVDSNGNETEIVSGAVDFTSDPTLSLDENTLYVGDENGNLHAYRLVDEGPGMGVGTERWTPYATGGDINTQPALSPLGDTIYVGSEDGSLHAVNASTGTGTTLFSNPSGQNIDSSPLVNASGVIYFGSDRVSGLGKFYAINPDGTPNKPVMDTQRDVRSHPAFSSDQSKIYFGDDRGFVYAYNTSTGSDDWISRTRINQTGGPPTNSAIRTEFAVGANGNIYFGDSAGRMFAFDSAGAQLGFFQTIGGNSRRAPVVEPGTDDVYFISGSGKAYCLDGNDVTNWGNESTPGTAVKWVGDMGGSSRATPVLFTDVSGTVTAYAGTNERLHAFTEPSSGFQLKSNSVTIGMDYLASDTLAAGDIVFTQGGSTITDISVDTAHATPIQNNNDGTFSIQLSGTPLNFGTISVSSNKNGEPYLAPINNLGSGYPDPAVLPSFDPTALTVTITPNSGIPTDRGSLTGSVTGRNADGSLNLTFSGTAGAAGSFEIEVDDGPPAGTMTAVDINLTTPGSTPNQTVTTLQGTMAPQTITVTSSGANAEVSIDSIKGTMAPQTFTADNAGTPPGSIKVTALEGTMAAPEKFSVGIAATPTPVTGGTNYNSTPTIEIYNNVGLTGPPVATVASGDVTLSGGSLSIDLSTLPAGANTAGDYWAKAVDGAVYLDPAGTTANVNSSGYTAGLPTSVTITGPGATPTVVTQDPATPISVDGAIFTFSMQTTPGNTDKLKVIASGTPRNQAPSPLRLGPGHWDPPRPPSPPGQTTTQPNRCPQPRSTPTRRQPFPWARCP